MVNKNYQSGRNFEYRVKRYLEEKGYYVMRSAGSKSPFDLIAVPTHITTDVISCVLLIQCKYGTKISKKEKEKIQEIQLSFSPEIECIVAWAKSHGQIELQRYALYFKKWEKAEWL